MGAAERREPVKLLSIPEVAERLGVTNVRVREMLRGVREGVIRIGLGPRPMIRIWPFVVERLRHGDLDDTPESIAGREMLHRICRRKYKMTLSRYDRLMREQNNACAICRQPFAERGLKKASPCVDHCHKTKRLRGLLCGPCNRGLGHFADDTTRMERAVEYLRQWGDSP